MQLRRKEMILSVRKAERHLEAAAKSRQLLALGVSEDDTQQLLAVPLSLIPSWSTVQHSRHFAIEEIIANTSSASLCLYH